MALRRNSRARNPRFSIGHSKTGTPADAARARISPSWESTRQMESKQVRIRQAWFNAEMGAPVKFPYGASA